MNYKEDIIMEMHLYNLQPKHSDLIADGEIHRYQVVGDKLGTKNGWYVIYISHLHDVRMVVRAVFGSWKLNEKYYWASDNSKKLTYIEKSELANKISHAKIEYKKQKNMQQAKASETACLHWHSSITANPEHPYLVKKSIHHHCARQQGDNLVLPIIDQHKKIWSLQYISPDGRKRFLYGGAKKGNFIPIQGWINEPCIGIAEGFATCATLADTYIDMCLVAALDAYNLELVARTIRTSNPNAKIIIFGDDDRQTPGNPGATMARRAAVASGAALILPSWPSDAPLTLTDFNDLHCWLAAQAKETL